MAKKKTPAPTEPMHTCGHELWVHSRRTNSDPWRCHGDGCDCKTTNLTAQ